MTVAQDDRPRKKKKKNMAQVLSNSGRFIGDRSILDLVSGAVGGGRCHRDGGGSRMLVLRLHPYMFEVVLQHLLATNAECLARALGAAGIALE